jgi:hypothetical protein
MMNLNALITLYATLTAAHAYILGFVFDGNIYYINATFAELVTYIRQSRTSSKKGGVLQARIRVNEKQAAALVASGKAIFLGGAELLEDGKHNKGENFERIITERLTGKAWKKDSTKFWIAGDIEVEGKQIQIKFTEAELTNEKAINAALAAA